MARGFNATSHPLQPIVPALQCDLSIAVALHAIVQKAQKAIQGPKAVGIPVLNVMTRRSLFAQCCKVLNVLGTVDFEVLPRQRFWAGQIICTNHLEGPISGLGFRSTARTDGAWVPQT